MCVCVFVYLLPLHSLLSGWINWRQKTGPRRSAFSRVTEWGSPTTWRRYVHGWEEIWDCGLTRCASWSGNMGWAKRQPGEMMYEKKSVRCVVIAPIVASKTEEKKHTQTQTVSHGEVTEPAGTGWINLLHTENVRRVSRLWKCGPDRPGAGGVRGGRPCPAPVRDRAGRDSVLQGRFRWAMMRWSRSKGTVHSNVHKETHFPARLEWEKSSPPCKKQTEGVRETVYVYRSGRSREDIACEGWWHFFAASFVWILHKRRPVVQGSWCGRRSRETTISSSERTTERERMKKRDKKGENVHQTYPKVCVCVLHLVNVRPQKEGDGMLPLLLIGTPPFFDCFSSLSRTFTLIMIKLADSGTQQLARAVASRQQIHIKPSPHPLVRKGFYPFCCLSCAFWWYVLGWVLNLYQFLYTTWFTLARPLVVTPHRCDSFRDCSCMGVCVSVPITFNLHKAC